MKRFFFLCFTIAFAACQTPSQDPFVLSADEALLKATAADPILSPQAFAGMAANGSTDFILADLRSPSDVEKNPLAGSINIPLADLLESENLETLRSKKQVILYGDDLGKTASTWLLLTQLGFEDVKMIDSRPQEFLDFSPESARYDFAAIFKAAKEQHEKALEAGKPKPVAENPAPSAPKPAPKKKEVLEEEGC